jgi:hypothetical protein
MLGKLGKTQLSWASLPANLFSGFTEGDGEESDRLEDHKIARPWVVGRLPLKTALFAAVPPSRAGEKQPITTKTANPQLSGLA